MAYYQNAPQKKKSRINYGDTGSWDEEGTHYRKGKTERDSRILRTRRVSGESRSFGESSGSGEKRQPRSQGFKPAVRNTYRPAFREEHKPSQRPVSAPSLDQPSDYRRYEYRGGQTETSQENESLVLCGRNPIREALRSGRDIEKILVQKGDLNGSAREILAEAREKKILIQETDRRRLDEIAPHHQGLIAFAAAYAYSTVEEMLEEAEQKKEAPFLILLDGVTDPHNLGAVIRTAECVGAHGVILPVHRSVGLTPAAVKASAGAIEHIKVARVTNLNRTIEDLKRHGVWTYAVTMNGKDYEKVDFRGGTALVIGAEGEGISRLTEEKCDLSVSLPMLGSLDSLNASVAAGVIMYRVLSCRRKG